MPIYEYKCKKCGSVGEFLVGVTQEKTELVCTSCGSADMEKLLSRSFTPARPQTPGSCDSCMGDGDPPPCCRGGGCSNPV